jgi:hypothetical protein
MPVPTETGTSANPSNVIRHFARLFTMCEKENHNIDNLHIM